MLMDKTSTISTLLRTIPGTDERKAAVKEAMAQILNAVRVCATQNPEATWELVRMDTFSESPSIKDMVDNFEKDLNATDKLYQEYEIDFTAFQTYVENPPLMPSLGRINAILENADFTQSSLANFPHKGQKADSALKSPSTTPNHGLIKYTCLLIQSSFLRYFRAKIRIESSLNSKSLRKLQLDLTQPGEWYPAARAMRRKVFLHVGPTNSGKTFHALQALRNANSGYYAGPLRLLAREIFHRFRSEGRPCNLVTGEEVFNDKDAYGLPAKVSSGTIEMIDTNNPMDVAIIDEIQMIEDEFRGWAWTHAFLGVQAREVHLCGDLSTESLIRKMCLQTGDELIVKKYNRLGKLTAEPRVFRDFRPGDCLVAFSKKDLLDQKEYIERTQKSNCAIIYGALPPESRSKQAELFNTPGNGYDYLVASDAIGMGLNLSIKRVIFLNIMKFNGRNMEKVSISQMKQIAGRAGRYRVAPKNPSTVVEKDSVIVNTTQSEETEGLVTAFDLRGLKYIAQCLKASSPTILKAGLFPSDSLFRQYALPLYNHEPFASILQRIQVSSTVSNAHFLSGIEGMAEVAKYFNGIKGLSLKEQLLLSKAPVKTSNDKCVASFQEFCTVIAKCKSATLLDMNTIDLSILKRKGPFTKQDITEFESLHSIIILYLWLSIRFPINFLDRLGAFNCKSLCERLIDQGLLDTRDKRLKYWARKTMSRRERDERDQMLRPETEDREPFDIFSEVTFDDEKEPSARGIN